MRFDRRPWTKNTSQRSHGFLKILFREPREQVRIGNLEVTFQAIVRPRKAKNLQCVPRRCPIRVTVKSAMQQDVAGTSRKTALETRLFKCAAQHHRRIARDVSMPWNNESGIESVSTPNRIDRYIRAPYGVIPTIVRQRSAFTCLGTAS
jgi:hypothetical protein